MAERSGCSFKQAAASLCVQAVRAGPCPASILVKFRLEYGRWSGGVRGAVGKFGVFLKLLCCVYHAVSQHHSGGRGDKREEVFSYAK